jgi:hypothetical protein
MVVKLGLWYLKEVYLDISEQGDEKNKEAIYNTDCLPNTSIYRKFN